MNPKERLVKVAGWWKSSVIQGLGDFGRIPSITPGADLEWKKNGHIDRGLQHLASWSEAQTIRDLTIEKLEIPGKTPILLMKIPGTIPGRVLIYGHADKQPAGEGWKTDPWEPVLVNMERLYGRGLADDGYSTFAAITAVRLLQYEKTPHPDIVILIEASEESGSPHLPSYLEQFSEKIGTPGLVICLDSGGPNYDRLWITNSLRGVVVGDLTVRVLTEERHSGVVGGIVPDSFAIACHLLDRVRNSRTGEVYPVELNMPTPTTRYREICRVADELGTDMFDHLPWHGNTRPDPSLGLHRVFLANKWKPTVAMIGQDRIPSIQNGEAKNSIQPFTTLRLSFRIPPTCDHNRAAEALKRILESDPPYKAGVSFTVTHKAPGFSARAMAPWLAQSTNKASLAHFEAQAMEWYEGASIPFVGMLEEMLKRAELLVIGVLGHDSNEHGPNEFLHIPTGIRITTVVADVIADYPQGGIAT